MGVYTVVLYNYSYSNVSVPMLIIASKSVPDMRIDCHIRFLSRVLMSLIWEKLLSTEADRNRDTDVCEGAHCYQYFVSGELCQL